LLDLALAAEFALTHFAFQPANQAGNLFVEIFETQVDFIAELSTLQRNLFPSNRAALVKSRNDDSINLGAIKEIKLCKPVLSFC
jgi:hypothetical protein